MRHSSIAAALLLAACGASAGDDYPIGSGGGGGGTHGGGSGSGVDAATDDATGPMLSGRVCALTDLRGAGAGACGAVPAGLTVTLGTSTATPDAAGQFSLPLPAGSHLTWHVAGANVVTTVMPYGTSTVVPVIATSDYAALLNANGAGIFAGTDGSVVLSLLSAGQPAVGAKAILTPPAEYGPFYDSTDDAEWGQLSTGALGAVWFVGVPSGTASIAVTPMGATAATTLPEPIEAGALTFATEAI